MRAGLARETSSTAGALPCLWPRSAKTGPCGAHQRATLCPRRAPWSVWSSTQSPEVPCAWNGRWWARLSLRPAAAQGGCWMLPARTWNTGWGCGGGGGGFAARCHSKEHPEKGRRRPAERCWRRVRNTRGASLVPPRHNTVHPPPAQTSKEAEAGCSLGAPTKPRRESHRAATCRELSCRLTEGTRTRAHKPGRSLGGRGWFAAGPAQSPGTVQAKCTTAHAGAVLLLRGQGQQTRPGAL